MKTHRITLVAAVALTVITTLAHAAPPPPTIPAAERAALIALYDDTNGAGWTDSTGWRTGGDFSPAGTECSWFGVTCDGTPNVTRVQLAGNNLTGSLPTEIGDLTSLTHIELQNNSIGGSLPAELGDLDSLIYLFLYNNQLSGSLPPELANMDIVFWVILYNNQLTGQIPAAYGSFAALSGLFLENNQLEGPIPPELGDLTSLVDLNLSQNQLTGTIPAELADIPTLQKLWLYDNELTGTIPPELGGITNLRHLGLRNNRLEGEIPPALGSLSNLYSLGLQGNRFWGEVPAEIANLGNLWSTGLQFGWNALYTDDPVLDAFIDAHHYYVGGHTGTWSSTQTVAPDNIVLASIHDTSSWLTWDTIEFSADPGAYQVLYAEDPGGDWISVGLTWSKTDTAFPAAGLDPGTNYLFAVQTHTWAHENNKNDVLSEFGAIMPGTTSSIGCAAPEMVVPENGYPIVLSLTQSYSTYAWNTGASTPTIEAFDEIEGWYWVEVSWPGSCLETAVGYVDPWVVLVTNFEAGDTSDWSAVVGEE